MITGVIVKLYLHIGLIIAGDQWTPEYPCVLDECALVVKCYKAPVYNPPQYHNWTYHTQSTPVTLAESKYKGGLWIKK